MGALHSGCSELFGTHEAFLPLIEALHELCRGADGPSLLKVLRDHAPTWLAQMPGFLREEDRAAFQQEVFGATRERMLREFCDLMESLAATRPWVIILEDLHWSDFATVDALSRIARRDRKAAILVIATYRPMDVAAGGHPIRKVHQDLQIHGRSRSLLSIGLHGLKSSTTCVAVRLGRLGQGVGGEGLCANEWTTAVCRLPCRPSHRATGDCRGRRTMAAVGTEEAMPQEVCRATCGR